MADGSSLAAALVDVKTPPHRLRAWLSAAVVLAATIAAAAAITSPLRGPVLVAVYAAATLPGLPIGRLLFGKHPAGLFAGAAIGYAMTAFSTWAVIRSGMASAPAFVIAWAAVLAVAWVLPRRRAAPLVSLPAWSAPDSRVLAALLVAILLFVAVPYRKLGGTDGAGNRLYRAYFTADFVWHMALTAEVAKFDMPPQNPYLRGARMHYYWTYFLVPACVAGSGPHFLGGVEPVLKVNALCTAVLFGATVFLLAWVAVPRAWVALGSVLVAMLAASAEGWYALYDLWHRGRPLASLRDINVDALSAWTFQGLRVDGLLRSMWYNPQHSLAIALGLVSLLVAGAGGAAAPLGAALGAGLALGLSAAVNPVVGAMFATVYGGVILVDALRRPATLAPNLVRQLPAVLLVALGAGWCVANQMLEGAGGALVVEWGGPTARHWPAALLLSLGPLLVPALLGAWAGWRLDRRLWASLFSLGGSLVLMHAVRLTVEPYWVGFRAGTMIQATAAPLVASFLGALSDRRLHAWREPSGSRGEVEASPHTSSRAAVAAAACAAVLLAGLPTTVVDLFNVQDTDNREVGAGGFRWTLVVPPEEHAALEWVRRFTQPNAVVHLEPVTRGREGWSQVPTFAERRMAGGNALPLIPSAESERRMGEVQQLFATTDPEAAWGGARRLGIDYLWVGRAERVGYTEAAIQKFDNRPDRFTPVFWNSEVTVYAVRP